MAAVAVIGLVFFLSIFPVKRYTVPIGWDSSEYLWRTSLAQKVGVVNIDRSLPAVPNPKSGRPAVPALVAILSSAGRLSTFRVTMVLSSVLAVAIGLACAAFLGSMLVARPPWELAAVALGVAFSPTVIRLMMPEGYLDTMLAAAVLVAAAIPLGLSLIDRRALLPAVLLLGVGAMIHWTFFVVLAAAVGGTAVLFAPFSWVRWRRGEQPMLDTPSARLVEAVADRKSVV